MKTIEIVGEDYIGHFNQLRYASRAVIIKDNKILLSHEAKNDLWMIPGGGLENDETARDAAIREVREETGHIIEVGDLILEIDEYYGDNKFVTYYFFGDIKGITKQSLTEVEIKEQLEPRWMSIEEALDIFSHYEKYTQTFIEKSGLYYREYTALNYMLNHK